MRGQVRGYVRKTKSGKVSRVGEFFRERKTGSSSKDMQTVFHATRRENLASIQKKGLGSWSSDPEIVPRGKHQVYFGSSLGGTIHEGRSFLDGSEPGVVLQLKIPKKRLKDEDAGVWTHRGIVHPRHIEKVHTIPPKLLNAAWNDKWYKYNPKKDPRQK